jgi:CHASE2 domain-containing sensor protein
MPNIFISYRREDAPANARLIYERLREWFGDGNSFMDVEEIELGDDWKEVLDQRVTRCDALLALIGPRWLTAASGDGRRRLDDPDDFVRWEIRAALTRGKRIIPVLVDGAPLPRASDLPSDLTPLARLQAQTVTHAAFDRDVDTVIEAITAAPGRVGSLAQRFTRLARMGRASLAVAALVAVVVISLAWANVFDLLGLDTRTASFTMLLGDILFEVPLSGELALIGIRPRPDEVNALHPSRRREYATLVDTLAHHGARTVAFDIQLDSPSEFDGELLRSIRAADKLGTAVVFGFQELLGREPATLPDLSKVSHLGLTCVGAKLDKAVFGTVALREADRVYGSLPLEAVFAPSAIGWPPPKTDLLQIRLPSGESRWLRFSFRQGIERADPNCPARAPGTEVARVIMRLSHRERLREASRRFDMSAVLNGTVDPRVFSGKRVLVGAEHPLDALETRMDIGQQRYGFEFHADVMNALLNEAVIRPMPFAAQWLLVLLMIVGAAAYRLWRLKKPHRWDVLVLIAGCALYLVATVILYAQFQLLVDGLYHIAAFSGTWWLLAALEQRWFHGTHVTA